MEFVVLVGGAQFSFAITIEPLINALPGVVRRESLDLQESAARDHPAEAAHRISAATEAEQEEFRIGLVVIGEPLIGALDVVIEPLP